jgi:predicted esterase
MKKISLAICLALVPVLAASQALPNINSLRVAYNTRKASTKPEGELKAQIDAVDKAIADASRAGNLGEVRRQMAKGMSLLAGNPWTPQVDYQNSLTLRSERTVIDSAVPYALRLEQIYLPSIELSTNLTVKASIRKRVPPAARNAPPAPPVPSTDLGTFDAMSRDLRESPYPLELNVSAIEDGNYLIDAEVFDGTTAVGRTSLGVMLQKGIDARLSALESGAAKLPAALKAEVLFPGDFIKNVNRGRIGLGTFDLSAALTAAEGVLTAAKSGKDPFKGRTGDMERHYLLEGANEIMPYRVYVPKSYDPAKGAPLVFALHGLGATEDGFFDSDTYQRLPVQLAEKHGVLLAAPLGFRSDGFYGSGLMGATDVASKRRFEYSEKDTMEVLRLMRANYKVDDSRIYLMGHSMGAIGAWYLGQKYPDIWAAIVPFAGAGSPDYAERIKAIPQFIVHGDNDPTVNVGGSRRMVEALKKAGANPTYTEVPGGGHSDVVAPNLPRAFEFMVAQRKTGGTSTKH